MGFWQALREVFGATKEQRCWFHKTGNVLNAMPKSVQAKAKGHLHDIWQAETRVDAEAAFDFFVATYDVKYDKAVARLAKDRQVLPAIDVCLTLRVVFRLALGQTQGFMRSIATYGPGSCGAGLLDAFATR